jgi:hypothetical protein
VKKKLLTLIFGLLAASFVNAAPPRGVVLDRPMEAVARTLQARLPTLSMDDDGWNFEFRLKADKTTAEEVRVVIRAVEPGKTELRVQGIRIESAMITDKRMADPALTQEWTEKIRKLIEEAG